MIIAGLAWLSLEMGLRWGQGQWKAKWNHRHTHRHAFSVCPKRDLDFGKVGNQTAKKKKRYQIIKACRLKIWLPLGRNPRILKQKRGGGRRWVRWFKMQFMGALGCVICDVFEALKGFQDTLLYSVDWPKWGLMRSHLATQQQQTTCLPTFSVQRRIWTWASLETRNKGQRLTIKSLNTEI